MYALNMHGSEPPGFGHRHPCLVIGQLVEQLFACFTALLSWTLLFPEEVRAQVPGPELPADPAQWLGSAPIEGSSQSLRFLGMDLGWERLPPESVVWAPPSPTEQQVLDELQLPAALTVAFGHLL